MGYACKLSGLNLHNKTYTLASGSTANITQDMGALHSYRYAAWPYTTCTIKCTLKISTTAVGSSSTSDVQTNSTTTTITVNIKNQTKSISGTSVNRNAQDRTYPLDRAVARGTASISITSITFT